MYSWTTTVRAMNRVREGERDVWIDQRLLSEEHVHHCAMVLAGNGGEEGVLRGTQVEVRFTNSLIVNALPNANPEISTFSH